MSRPPVPRHIYRQGEHPNWCAEWQLPEDNRAHQLPKTEPERPRYETQEKEN